CGAHPRGGARHAGRGPDRAARHPARRRAVDGGDAADLHAGALRHPARRRLRRARRLSAAQASGSRADAPADDGDRPRVESVPHHRRVVSVAHAGRLKWRHRRTEFDRKRRSARARAHAYSTSIDHRHPTPCQRPHRPPSNTTRAGPACSRAMRPPTASSSMR
ncbi:hypothetical protein, partial [Ralstonia solanacearum]|uniref:hypothetical protein n=1 Tax=Ralstonia solanacearum TaxID=305 RepID=UPI003CC86D18